VAGPPFSKYLNFGAAGSGFIVTPTTLPGVPVDGFRITTANDAPGRDPAAWSLYGFNGALTTTDSGASPLINQTGLAEAWTLIASGAVSLPGDPAVNLDQRGVVGPMVAVNSTTPFDHYKFIVDAIKRPSDNIMQFAEIQFFADDSNLGSGILRPTDPIIAVDGVPTPPGWKPCGTPNTDCSNYPGGEAPRFGIDQRVNAGGMPDSKYLNFGEERSGIIITNSEGPVQVRWMRLTTGGDAVERDPASFELYGTNDPVTSQDNSNGTSGTEVWTPIANGPLSLPGVLPNGGGDDARWTHTGLLDINAQAAYSSYRLVFPTVKSAGAANSMQIGDIQFYAVPEPSSLDLVFVAGGLAGLVAWRKRKQSSEV
jgi:hypothetical protein